MRSGHLRPRRCPLIYHQKSGQKRGVTWWRLFKKCALAISGPGVATSYTTRKTEQMETAAAYFFEKPPLTNRDIFGWFSDWPSGNFSKSFSAYPAGAARCTGGEKLPLIYQDIFSLFPSGEVENFLILRYVAGGMPPGRKRGRHCEKYRPCFGAFCKRKLSGFSHHHFLLFLSKTVLTGTHFRYHPYLSL